MLPFNKESWTDIFLLYCGSYQASCSCFIPLFWCGGNVLTMFFQMIYIYCFLFIIFYLNINIYKLIWVKCKKKTYLEQKQTTRWLSLNLSGILMQGPNFFPNIIYTNTVCNFYTKLQRTKNLVHICCIKIQLSL